jgi:hypothetical protein
MSGPVDSGSGGEYNDSVRPAPLSPAMPVAGPGAGRGAAGTGPMTVRPFDLRRGDVLLDDHNAVVEGAGWAAKRGGRSHVWLVPTSIGERTWPLQDHARFEIVRIARAVEP